MERAGNSRGAHVFLGSTTVSPSSIIPQNSWLGTRMSGNAGPGRFVEEEEEEDCSITGQLGTAGMLG